MSIAHPIGVAAAGELLLLGQIRPSIRVTDVLRLNEIPVVVAMIGRPAHGRRRQGPCERGVRQRVVMVMSDRITEAHVVMSEACHSRRVQMPLFSARRQVDNPIIDAVPAVDLLPDHEKAAAPVDLTFVEHARLRVERELPGRFHIDDTPEQCISAFHA